MSDNQPFTAADLYRRLEELGITVQVHDHPPLFTVDDSKRLRGEIPGGHCKNLFLKNKKGAMWLVVALEETAIDLKALTKVLDAGRLSFGSPELLYETLGITPGSVSPLALMNDRDVSVSVILERRMMDLDLLNYHPLTNEQTITIAAADLRRFLDACGHQPAVMDLPMRAAEPD